MVSLWQLRRRARTYAYAYRCLVAVWVLPRNLRAPVQLALLEIHREHVRQYELDRLRDVIRSHEAELDTWLEGQGIDDRDLFERL